MSEASPPMVPAASSSVTAAGGDPLSQQSQYVQQAFACIRQIESNNEPWVINPSSGDSGLYQFNDGTWLAHGGGQFASRAYLASVVDQDTVAVWTYEADGFSPWDGDNRCWE